MHLDARAYLLLQLRRVDSGYERCWHVLCHWDELSIASYTLSDIVCSPLCLDVCRAFACSGAGFSGHALRWTAVQLAGIHSPLGFPYKQDFGWTDEYFSVTFVWEVHPSSCEFLVAVPPWGVYRFLTCWTANTNNTACLTRHLCIGPFRTLQTA